MTLRARPRTLLLAAATAAPLLLLPHPVASGDERDQLRETSRRLGQVESVLRNARAEAGAVAAALAEADREVAAGRRRLALAGARLDAARQRRAGAAVALNQATDEVDAHEVRLAEQVRGAYMTGRVAGLAAVVDSADLTTSSAWPSSRRRRWPAPSSPSTGAPTPRASGTRSAPDSTCWRRSMRREPRSG